MSEMPALQDPVSSLSKTLGSVWTLLFGIGLLMLANGLQGTLLGVRAAAEGFDPATIGLMMSGFFVGLLVGSLWTPRAIRLVGHVRVFAAMAAVASVSILLHAMLVDALFWWAVRVITGFCYAGILVVAESWLNDQASPGTRGTILALYMAVTFGGMGGGQLFLNLASSEEALLFMLVSVLISLAVVPLLLNAAQSPVIRASRPVPLRRLATASPLGVCGVFVAGIVNGTIFGMGAVYAQRAGYSIADTALLMTLLIVGAALFQWPIGRLSDRYDRRLVLTTVTALAAIAASLGAVDGGIDSIGGKAMIATVGGLSLSIYSLSLAYTNDYLESDERVGASSGLILILGIGSVIGPIVVGLALTLIGPDGFFWWLAANHAGLAAFAFWRMSRRAALPDELQAPYVLAPLQGSELAVTAAEEAAAVKPTADGPGQDTRD